jgi:hypothetical protein
MQLPGPTRATPLNHARRFAWLLACVFAGLVIGIIGSSVSGNSVWYVAIPAVVAVGWLFVANPTQCEPPRDQPAKRSPGNETSP